MTVPLHLRHLPTHRGLAVPYVACWGDEVDPERWRRLRDVRVNNAWAWWTCDWEPGRGAPHFGELNLQRSREVVVENRCRVCAKIIGARPRWVVVLNVAASEVKIGPDSAIAVDPWACSRCLSYLLASDPAVREAKRAGTGAVLRLETWQLTYEEKFLRSQRAVGLVKIVPREGTLYEFADVTPSLLKQAVEA